ncbi:MAG: hypothetical protein WA849_06110 [Candidatus Udaeobacter sp.]
MNIANAIAARKTAKNKPIVLKARKPRVWKRYIGAMTGQRKKTKEPKSYNLQWRRPRASATTHNAIVAGKR